jgi:hypothetical protein
MLRTHDFEVTLQRLDDGLGQDGDSVLAPLAVADHDLAQVEVEVLDPQLQGLLQAQAATVENRPDQPVFVLESGEHGADFLVSEHDRKVP